VNIPIMTTVPVRAALVLLLLSPVGGGLGAAWAQTSSSPIEIPSNKEFDDYTQSEKDAAKTAALHAQFSAFRVCGDPGNMPLSNQREEGYENKIADVLAQALGTRASYFWRPYIERGLTRQTFDTNDCDILMDVPADYEAALNTIPIYRSTYVLAYRAERGYNFKDLTDPRLHDLRIGVFELSALREALANDGVVGNVSVHEVSHDADLVEAHQPWRQVQDVVDGKLDIAAVWGPFAGWFNTMRGAHLTLQPTNVMDDVIPMEFDMAIGVRKTSAVLKYAIDNALNAHRGEIEAILRHYGVPLVQCAQCLIAGDLKAHGLYVAPRVTAADMMKLRGGPPAVSRAQLDRWLRAGADPNRELSDAVLASDTARITYLLTKGADINRRDDQGYTPLAAAARLSSLDTVRLLLEKGARPEDPDSDGWTPLLHAVLRNDVGVMKLLIAHGASVEHAAPGAFSPLCIAVEEGRFDAAQALIDAGAKIDVRAGHSGLTPLMVVASETPTDSRILRLTQTYTPLDIARALIARHAAVDATTPAGLTPLMIASAQDNASMVGLLLQSGARADRTSAAGETAHAIALRTDSQSAARIIDLMAHTQSQQVLGQPAAVPNALPRRMQ
jgi:quinoprotein dehydrogenase-associated probable ABC transporter substrate-binding protein